MNFIFYLFLLIYVSSSNAFEINLTAVEYRYMSQEKKTFVGKGIAAFMIKLERQEAYLLDIHPKLLKNVWLWNNWSIEFFETLEARGSLVGSDGGNCYFGGYISKMKNGYCMHPSKVPESGYDKDQPNCNKGQVRCSPQIFPDAGCVVVNSKYSQLSSSCADKSDFGKASVNPQKLNDFLLNIEEFCKNNPRYDACSSLSKAIGEIKKLPDIIPNKDKETMAEVLKVLQKPKHHCSYLDPEKVTCGAAQKQSLDDLYSKGFIDTLTDTGVQKICGLESGGGFSKLVSEPNSKKAMDQLKKIKPEFLYTLNHMQNLCKPSNYFKDKSEEKEGFANLYMAIDFTENHERLEKSNNDLLAAKRQLDMLFKDRDGINCNQHHNEVNKDFCNQLNGCSAGSAAEVNNLMNKKRKADYNIFKTYQQKLAQRKHIIGKKNARTQGRFQSIEEKKLDSEIAALETQNHFLKSSEIKDYQESVNSKVFGKIENTENNFNRAYNKFLSSTRKNIDDEIAKNIQAQKCLENKSDDCDNLKDQLKKLKAYEEIISYKDTPELNESMDVYRCINNQARNISETDEILAGAGIDLALTAVTFGAGSAFIAAKMGSKIAKISSASATGADAAYTVNGIKKSYQACTNIGSDIIKNAKAKNDQCAQFTASIGASIDVQDCQNQVILTAGAGMAIGTGTSRLNSLNKTNQVNVPNAPTIDSLSLLARTKNSKDEASKLENRKNKIQNENKKTSKNNEDPNPSAKDSFYQSSANRKFKDEEKYISIKDPNSFGSQTRLPVILLESKNGVYKYQYKDADGVWYVFETSDPNVIKSIRASKTSKDTYTNEKILDLDDKNEKINNFRRSYNSKSFKEKDAAVSFTFGPKDRRAVKILEVYEDGSIKVITQNSLTNETEEIIISDMNIIKTGATSSDFRWYDYFDNWYQQKGKGSQREQSQQSSSKSQRNTSDDDEPINAEHDKISREQKRQKLEELYKNKNSINEQNKIKLRQSYIKTYFDQGVYDKYSRVISEFNALLKKTETTKGVLIDKGTQEARQLKKDIKSLLFQFHSDRNSQKPREVQEALNEFTKELNNYSDLLDL